MNHLTCKIKKSEWKRKDGPWDLIIGMRLYLVVMIIMAPLFYVISLVGYLSPLILMIFGISVWLILTFVIFEARTASKIEYYLSFLILIPFICTVFFNFLLGLIININHSNIAGIYTTLFICVGSVIYFLVVLLKSPFKKLNNYFISSKSRWVGRKKHNHLKKHVFKLSLVIWLFFSIILIIIPHPRSIQNHALSTNSESGHIGFWTYGQPLDNDKVNSSRYLNNATLQMLGDAGVYFVLGIQHKNIDESRKNDTVDWLNRLKDHNIEVHLSITPKKDEERKLQFVNIWTFEELSSKIIEVLNFLNNSNFISDPITTLVYDMEGLPLAHFPLYGNDANIINKISEYYIVQASFTEFNQQVESNFDLKIRIVSDLFQAIDYRDGDDDIISMWGLMSYQSATMSYMVYRRDDKGMNFIYDHNRFLKEGDTVILNSWKFDGYFCYDDIDCAIAESQLVLGYPGKTLNLEIWALWYFIGSYGVEGLYTLVDAIIADKFTWENVDVWNYFPSSTIWDLFFYGIALFDLYAPLFRLSLNIL